MYNDDVTNSRLNVHLFTSIYSSSVVARRIFLQVYTLVKYIMKVCMYVRVHYVGIYLETYGRDVGFMSYMSTDGPGACKRHV